ncbi:2Fe-2S iron-sulfur cluster-binding protein [Chondromyces crocatus]|uniref:Ferredoxin n=1 Tax=Chondromyces crocatus TaxID=52 RepID=A0A0K1ERJ8_CHOCO|nr:2Fe-2S iron-sulfur cluster-binding protein [Chondromyces crocatus]AKT43444.1 ferredoxin [Chondromyces crocatus]
MPTISFEASSLGPALSVDGEGALIDICDSENAPVGFSCRAAACATCQIEILAGAEHLESPGPDEKELLSMLGATETERLACQAVVRRGPGLIRIRWVGDGM